MDFIEARLTNARYLDDKLLRLTGMNFLAWWMTRRGRCLFRGWAQEPDGESGSVLKSFRGKAGRSFSLMNKRPVA